MKQSDFLPGTLDMLVLQTLTLEPMHGSALLDSFVNDRKTCFRSVKGLSTRLCNA